MYCHFIPYFIFIGKDGENPFFHVQNKFLVEAATGIVQMLVSDS